MDIKKLVPIDFSRKITPLVIGDVMWNSLEGVQFKMENYSQLRNFNENIDLDWAHIFVISYADRPNTTGKQPVDDNVIVDFAFRDGLQGGPALACNHDFIVVGHDDEVIKSWKPNHAAAFELCQASLAKTEDDRMNNIARNGGDGEHYDKTEQPIYTQYERVKQLEDAFNEITGMSEYEDCYDIAVVMLDLASTEDVTPVYTKAMRDNGEMAPIGSVVLIIADACDENGKHFSYEDEDIVLGHVNGKYIVKDRTISLDRVIVIEDVKPIQTDKEKLRDAMRNLLIDSYGENLSTVTMGTIYMGIDKLIASDRFTITLNKEY